MFCLYLVVFCQKLRHNFNSECDTPEKLLLPLTHNWGSNILQENLVNRVRPNNNTVKILGLGGYNLAKGKYNKRFF